jgi:hypothetical protein
VAGVWAWYLMRPPAFDAMTLAECRTAYGSVHTNADTVRIDDLIPERAGRGQRALTCGDMRRAYPESLLTKGAPLPN